MSMFSKMPGILIKLVELAGAGLASAAGAFLFAQFTRPATPPPPQIVQIEQVPEELVRAVRSENAALIQELRKVEIAKETASEAAPPRVAVASPKPQKSGQAPASGHQPKAGGMVPDKGLGAADKALGADKGLAADKKSERANEADTKAPMDERAPPAAAAPIVPAAAAPTVAVSAPNPAAADPASTSAIDQVPVKAPELEWIARLKQIPDIFRVAPPAASAAPRPPLPVGELVQGAM
jgi:hypothetical protein